MSEETRQEILDLLARKKIGVDEAVMLLGELQEPPTAVPPQKPENPPQEPQSEEDVPILIVEEPAFEGELKDTKAAAPTAKNGRKPGWLRVRVRSLDTGKNKVTVNIPFGMVKFGLGVAKRFSPEVGEVDLNELSEMMNSAEAGMIVDVQDEESNEHVQVFLD